MRRTHLVWLALFVGVSVCAAASGQESSGGAEGVLVLDGRSYPLRFACVRQPSTLEIALSNAPLDASLLKKADLDETPPGIVILGIRVNGRGRATSVFVKEAALPDGILNNDRVGDFQASALSPALAEGTLVLAPPRKVRGHELSYSVRFRGLPPPRGPVRNLDDALERVPAVRRFLDGVAPRLKKAVPIGCGSGVVLIAILALVWKFVIAPRRAHRLLMEIAQRGYAPVDRKSPDLAAALEGLAPFALEGTVRYKEWPREILDALVRTSGFHPRYLVNVSQLEEGSPPVGSGPSGDIQIWQTLILELRPLSFEREITVRQRGFDWFSPGREEKYGFRPARVPEALPEFERLYDVFSRDGSDAPLSAALQRAFVEVSRILLKPAFPNTRLTPRGWGLCASDAWLDRKTLNAVLDAADKISAAL
ncbi:MAG TPA: hypothetical protein VKE50_09820 [Thermoanaerobaculia bacterium]|nr:hypothetical protein [Thermoanaerobaculia bacterium]